MGWRANEMLIEAERVLKSGKITMVLDNRDDVEGRKRALRDKLLEFGKTATASEALQEAINVYAEGIMYELCVDLAAESGSITDLT
jgi:hypothetical protein